MGSTLFQFLHERTVGKARGGACVQRIMKAANGQRRSGMMDRHGPCRRPRPLMTPCFILYLEQQRHMLFFSRIRSITGLLRLLYGFLGQRTLTSLSAMDQL